MKIINKISNIIKIVISNSDEASHKRLLSLLSFIILIIILILNAFGIIISNILIYVFAGLCAGNTTLSVIEKILNK